jgi:hypothetical protein
MSGASYSDGTYRGDPDNPLASSQQVQAARLMAGMFGGRSAAPVSSMSYLPVIDPMTAINPVYTRQPAVDSLAPMRALEGFRQTGQAADPTSHFKAYTPPPPSMVAVNTGGTGGAK